MIKVKNLSFGYRSDALVLKNINISFDHRSTAIIGQNGAGKTTFAKLLKNLLKPRTGSIYINDQDISQKTTANLAPTVGLVFQNPNDQIFKQSCMEEVLFGPSRINMREEEARIRSANALKEVGLFERSDTNPNDLGLSQRKLLCIASVLAMNTPIVILDEPTMAQDHHGKQYISRTISRLKQEGRLVITIIHDMDFVAENFERTVILNEGELILDGETRYVFSRIDKLVESHVEPPCVAKLSQRLNKGTLLNQREFKSNYLKQR